MALGINELELELESCQIKRQRNVLLLYTRVSRKSQVANSLPANARLLINIGTRFSVFSWMDFFSSIHITTRSITICAKLLFSINTFHCNYM